MKWKPLEDLGYWSAWFVYRELVQRIDRLGGFEGLWLPKKTRQPKQYRSLNYKPALALLGISEGVIKRVGPTRALAMAKKRYKALLLLIHPDTATVPPPRSWYGPLTILRLKQTLERIERERFMPIDIDNVNQVLDVEKGFITTAEVDYGLNGPT